PPGPYDLAPASAAESAYACRFLRSDIASPASNTMTPRTVSATMIATTITTAWPLCERRSRARICSVLREHGGGRGDAQQVWRGAAQKRNQAVVAVDHSHDNLEAAFVLRVRVFGSPGAQVAWHRVAAQRASRRRAASGPGDVTKGTANTSIEIARMKKRSGKTSANSTSACPLFCDISIRSSSRM